MYLVVTVSVLSDVGFTLVGQLLGSLIAVGALLILLIRRRVGVGK
jgi:hypothetical protein